MRPKLEAVHIAEAKGLSAATNGDLARPKILKESEDLLCRFDALDANIETWVGQVETASKEVKEFQVRNMNKPKTNKLAKIITV